LRLGRYADSPLPGVELAAECRQAWEDISTLLDRLGHDVVDTTSPFEVLLPPFEVLWAVSAHSAPVPQGEQDALLPFTRWLRERGAAVSGSEFLQAIARVQHVGRAVVAAHADFDAVLTPDTGAAAPTGRLVQLGTHPRGGLRVAEAIGAIQRAVQRDRSACPISLPLHWTDDGLPVGVQLVGRPAGEGSLLALAGQWERARPWAQRRPPTWRRGDRPRSATVIL